MDTVGDRVRQARQEQGLTMRALAETIGKKESYVSELERGGIRKGSMLHRIAAALEVNLAWLETGRGPKPLSDARLPADSGRHPFPGPKTRSRTLEPTEGAWRAYLTASAATRAAIDLLLLPVKERRAITETHDLVSLGIELLEKHANEAMKSRKTA